MKNILFLILICNLMLFQCRPDKSDGIEIESTPDTVVLFAQGNISTSLYERDMAISPNGEEIIFTLADYKQSKRCLVRIVKHGNIWGEKEILSFSGQYIDIEPFFSVSGNELYFASDRPIETGSERKDYNIWVSKKINDGWGEPQALSSSINSERDEYYPSVSKNGNMYFTSVRENGIGSEDILISRFVDGNYSDPEPLDSTINSKTYEFNAWIHPDENLIIFSSYGRKDDLGGGDLYFSKKDTSGKWSPAHNMGPKINSDKLDYCPFIDISRGNFYFTSDRNLAINKKIENVSEIEGLANDVLNGMGNIFRISTAELMQEN